MKVDHPDQLDIEFNDEPCEFCGLRVGTPCEALPDDICETAANVMFGTDPTKAKQLTKDMEKL